MLPNLSSITSQVTSAATGADAIAAAAKAMADVAKTAKDILSPALKVLSTALSPLITVIKDVSAEIVHLSKGLLDGLGNLAKRIDSATGGYFSKAATGVATSLGSIGKALVAVGVGAAAAGGAVLAIGQILSSFVQKANPVVFEQFRLVVDDLMAVIGRALVPIFKSVVIPVVRLFADTLMNLAPIGKAVAAALQPFVKVLGVLFELLGEELAKIGEIAEQLVPGFEALGEAFLAIMDAVKPVYTLLIDLIGGAFVEAAKLLSEAMKIIVPYVVAFARVVGDLVKQFGTWVREMLALIGIDLPEAKSPAVKPGSSTGAAARQVGHSSIEDVVKQAQRASFSLGTASADDPPKRTASASEAIKAKADQIYEKIANMPALIWDKVKELPDLIAEALRRNVPTKKDVAETLSRPEAPVAGLVLGGPIGPAAVSAAGFLARNVGDLLPSTPSWLKKK